MSCSSCRTFSTPPTPSFSLLVSAESTYRRQLLSLLIGYVKAPWILPKHSRNWWPAAARYIPAPLLQRVYWLEPLDSMLYGMGKPLRKLHRWRKHRRRNAEKPKKPATKTETPASEPSHLSTTSPFSSSPSSLSASPTPTPPIDTRRLPSPALSDTWAVVLTDAPQPLRHPYAEPDVLPSPSIGAPSPAATPPSPISSVSPAPAPAPAAAGHTRAPPPKDLLPVAKPPWSARFAHRCRRAEGCAGIGDEMLFCLQRGAAGARSWGRFQDLDGAVAQLQAQQQALANEGRDDASGVEPRRRLRVDVVFAGKDCMVGKDAAAWFRKLWEGEEAWVDFAAVTDEAAEHNSILGPRGHMAWMMREVVDLWEGR